MFVVRGGLWCICGAKNTTCDIKAQDELAPRKRMFCSRDQAPMDERRTAPSVKSLRQSSS